jgi:hypothetical protein
MVALVRGMYNDYDFSPGQSQILPHTPDFVREKKGARNRFLGKWILAAFSFAETVPGTFFRSHYCSSLARSQAWIVGV